MAIREMMKAAKTNKRLLLKGQRSCDCKVSLLIDRYHRGIARVCRDAQVLRLQWRCCRALLNESIADDHDTIKLSRRHLSFLMRSLEEASSLLKEQRNLQSNGHPGHSVSQ